MTVAPFEHSIYSARQLINSSTHQLSQPSLGAHHSTFAVYSRALVTQNVAPHPIGTIAALSAEIAAC